MKTVDDKLRIDISGCLFYILLIHKCFWMDNSEKLFPCWRYPINSPLADCTFGAAAQDRHLHGSTYSVNNFSWVTFHTPSIDDYTDHVQASIQQKV